MAQARKGSCLSLCGCFVCVHVFKLPALLVPNKMEKLITHFNAICIKLLPYTWSSCADI